MIGAPENLNKEVDERLARYKVWSGGWRSFKEKRDPKFICFITAASKREADEMASEMAIKDVWVEFNHRLV